MNAILIRQFVDGELSDDARVAFEARLESDTELQAAVAFERSLRDRVEHVLCGPDSGAPAGLRDRIAAAMAAADLDAADDPSFETNDVPVIGTIRPDGASNRADAQPWRGWAVAASLLLVASAVLFGIFGPSIGQPNQQVGAPVAEIAEQAANEHRSCAQNKDTLRRKLAYQDADDARIELSRILQHEVRIFDLDNDELDYEFIGGAGCQLPGCEDTVHLMYRRLPSQDRGGALLSVYVTPDFGNIKSLPKCPKGNTVWKTQPRSQKCSMEVAFCRDSRMIYVICCCDPSDIDAIRNAVDQQLMASKTE